MGTFKQFLDEQKLEPSTLVRLSSQVEARDDADRTLSRQRADKRRDKERQGKAYEGIAKPRSGRGVSAQQVGAAIADEPLSPKVRGKLVRAVNAALAKKGGAAVTFPALFGEVKASQGPTAKKAS